MTAKQGSPFVWLGAAFAIIVLVAALPLISVLISTGIAGALGCQVDEAAVHPCPFMGIDLGEMLTLMFILGWLGLVTLPLGVIALAVWLIIFLMTFVCWRRRRRREA